MAFADACLVRMAELHANASVWTLDADVRLSRKSPADVVCWSQTRRFRCNVVQDSWLLTLVRGG
jgi:hypothetical protein